MKFYLNCYNIVVEIVTSSAPIAEWILFDFSRFLDTLPKDPHITVEIYEEPPPPLPPTPSSSQTANYVLFETESKRHVQYVDGVRAEHCKQEERGIFYGTNREALYEKIYLFIQSRIGELLDNKGLHRVHGLGFSLEGTGILYLMPMGGGKSTLALKLRDVPNFLLYSDDTPLIDQKGNMLPFPSRLGVLEGEEPEEISPAHLRKFIRFNRSPKSLIHPDAISNWAQASVPISLVLIGRWTGAQNPSCHRVSKLKMWSILFRDCVIGLGLPQVVEFFLKNNLGDMYNKSRIALRRVIAITKICFRAKAYEIHLIQDQNANHTIIESVLSGFSRDRHSQTINSGKNPNYSPFC